MSIDITSCLLNNSASIVKVEENKAKATFSNDANENFEIYRNDGCVMTGDCRRADYVIRHRNHGELVVELKGRSVEHAVDQIAGTFDYWQKNNLFVGPHQAGLVVCKQVPHAAAAQKAQDKFIQRYKRKLRVLTHCEQREFSSFISSAK